MRALAQFGLVGGWRVMEMHFSLILSLIGVKLFLQDIFLYVFDFIIIPIFVTILAICDAAVHSILMLGKGSKKILKICI